MKLKFPQYIWRKTKYGFDNALKLVKVTNDGTKAIYWRNGGLYSASAKFEENRLMVQILSDTPIEYIECTEEDWMKDNSGYLDSDYDYYGFNIIGKIKK